MGCFFSLSYKGTGLVDGCVTLLNGIASHYLYTVSGIVSNGRHLQTRLTFYIVFINVDASIFICIIICYVFMEALNTMHTLRNKAKYVVCSDN